MHPARSRRVRRWYFLVLTLTLTLLVVLRFTVFRPDDGAQYYVVAVAGIVDNLIASVAVALVIGLAWVLLYDDDLQDGVQQVASRDIPDVLAAAAQGTREWRVRSRTANYFTKATLPLLANSALRSGRSVAIRARILDPENVALLETYARFRSNHSGSAARWNPDKVRREVYAAILLLAAYANEARRLDIDVYLSSDFWVVSVDIADDMALTTGQNKGDAALRLDNSTQFYEDMREDFDASLTQCRRVSPQLRGLTPEAIRGVLAASEIGAIREMYVAIGLSTLSDAYIKEIVDALGEDHHYA